MSRGVPFTVTLLLQPAHITPETVSFTAKETAHEEQTLECWRAAGSRAGCGDDRQCATGTAAGRPGTRCRAAPRAATRPHADPGCGWFGAVAAAVSRGVDARAADAAYGAGEPR